MSVDLSVKLANLAFPNPIIVASGPPSMSLRHILNCFEHGAGGVVTKTICFDPIMQVQPKPRMHVMNKKDAVAGKYYSLCSIDLSSEYEPEKWVDFLKEARQNMRRRDLEGVLIASIGGRDYEEWTELAKMVEGAGVDAIEMNLSCPHIEEGKLMGRAVASDPNLVRNVVKAVKKACSIPVVCKITPQGADPVQLAEAMVSAGADLLVSTARFQGLVIDIDEMEPISWGGYGGYGGPWQLPMSLSWTAHIASRKFGVPIVGAGGIASGDDIVKFIMVGADAIQICTAIIISGYDVIPRMKDRLIEWITSKGFTRIEEFKGIALDKIIPLEDLAREKAYQVLVDNEKCTSCAICERVCPYLAISLDQSRKPVVDQTQCDNCGLCVSICPFDAMELARK